MCSGTLMDFRLFVPEIMILHRFIRFLLSVSCPMALDDHVLRRVQSSFACLARGSFLVLRLSHDELLVSPCADVITFCFRLVVKLRRPTISRTFMLELTSMEMDFGYDSLCFYQTGTTISRVGQLRSRFQV